MDRVAGTGRRHGAQDGRGTMNDVERTKVEERRLDELRRHLVVNAFMDAEQVATAANLSVRTVNRYPFEVLPWTPANPESARVHRRYDPEDVRALPAVLRAWALAKAQGREAEWLDERREVLDARDRELMAAACGTS